MKSLKKSFETPTFAPINLFLTSILFSLLYVFMEWTYTFNKTSALPILFGEKLLILLNAAAMLSVLCFVVFVPYFVLHKLVKGQNTRVILGIIFALTPANLLTIMLLLLIDNITYTLWQVGVVTSAGFIRGLYAAIFILVCMFILTRIIRFTNRINRNFHKSTARTRKSIVAICFSLIVIFSILPVVTNPVLNLARNAGQTNARSSERPNIILITVDSLNAEKMSLYGFDKATTPFLVELAQTSLVGEDHFSNAQGTIGSLTSLLSGKYPADNRVLASADILREEDAFQHLPGILKDNGYETVQLSYSYYADAGNLNMQDGFTLANGEAVSLDPVSTFLSTVLPTDYFYFLRELYNRASDRLGHIFFIKDMKNPYKQMTESPEKFNDAYKIDTAVSLFETVDKPLFIHIHWMGTHGPKYYPENQVFSAGKDPKKQGSRDEAFYLDSILEFDTSMAQLYSKLNELGVLDNTIIIITADHSQRWSISRLPLIMRFPSTDLAGTIDSNTENLDIAPTLLNYLDIPQPVWMPGQSLLSIQAPDRPLFIAQIPDSTKDAETGKVIYPDPVAPFYQFGKMSVVVCDTWYQVNLQTLKLTTGVVRDYAGDCAGKKISEQQALDLIKQHLKSYGFDVTSLGTVEIKK